MDFFQLQISWYFTNLETPSFWLDLSTLNCSFPPWCLINTKTFYGCNVSCAMLTAINFILKIICQILREVIVLDEDQDASWTMICTGNENATRPNMDFRRNFVLDWDAEDMKPTVKRCHHMPVSSQSLKQVKEECDYWRRAFLAVDQSINIFCFPYLCTYIEEGDTF